MVDASNNAVYTSSTTDGKLIATITNCDNSNLANCTFSDSTTAGTGFSAYKIYNYIIVAVDADGNKQMALSQRYRSQYYNAGGAVTGAASFRLEPRYRRASVALVDEAYQQAQTRPQIMVHVPMDLSGLDHDFFIQKYEASSYSGSLVNNSPSGSQGSSEWPLQADASGVWKADASKCYDKMNQTAAFDNICGSGTAVNGTSTTVQSKQNAAPLASVDQGAMWKACRNTGIADDDGNTYYLSLPADSEWFKAADWGDLNHDGTIDIGPNAGTSIVTLENGAADTTTVRCHTDLSPSSAYSSSSSSTANCRSRFGALDMVGNVWEWTAGQIYNNVSYESGLEGLSFGLGLPSSGNSLLSLGRFDILRAFPQAANAAILTFNSDYYYTNSGLRGTIRGGGFQNANNNAGRYGISHNSAPQYIASDVGGRCRR